MSDGVKINKTLRQKITWAAIWDEFVFSSNLVALGDVLVLVAFSMILNIKVTISFFVVIYLSILAINFFNRYKEAEQDTLTNSQRLYFVKKYFKYTPYIMFTLLMASVLLTGLYASATALIFMIFLFGLGTLYSLFLKKITKKVIGFKNFMTALPYSLLVIFLSLFYDVPIVFATYLIAIFYFLRIFINTTYFDIKDIDSDRDEGLRTLPVIFGKNKTITILAVVNIISIIPILIGICFGLLPIYAIGIIATVFYALTYLRNNIHLSQKVLYNVVVDGEFIFWLPCIVLFRAISG